MHTQPRLRMFAGPNGSGKSTLKSVISPNLLGVYINPDEIEKEIRSYGFLDLSAYGIKSTKDEILPFFQSSSLLHRACKLNCVNAHRLQFHQKRKFYEQHRSDQTQSNGC